MFRLCACCGRPRMCSALGPNRVARYQAPAQIHHRYPCRLRRRGSVCKNTAVADRQFHSNDDGHCICDRSRHGSSAVRSVLDNWLTRTPGACKRLSFFQPDCHSVRTHLSRRVYADGPLWGPFSKRRLAQCFLSLRFCRGGRWVCPPDTWQAQERTDRALTATCDFMERGDRNHCGVYAGFGRYGRT